MKFSRRTNYALIGFLVMINIAFRCPTTPHELGVDSFAIHTIANSVSHYGYATWIVHPFSYFGLTPESMPTAYPYIVSGLSQLSGLNMEFTILLFSILLGVMGAFNCFLMAKEIKNNDLFIFIVVFAFSLSPIFLRFTIWTASSRNLFLTLFPLFIWTVFRNLHQPKIEYKYIAISLILFMILLSIHRMAMLIPIFMLAFFVSVYFYKKLVKFSFSKKTWVIAPSVWVGVFIFFIFAQLLDWGFYSELRVESIYQKGYFFKGDNFLDKLLNMGADYFSRYGPLLILGILTIIIMLFFTKKYYTSPSSKIKVHRSFNNIIFPLVILFYTPLIIIGVYVSLVLLPFICLIIGFGTIYLIERFINIRNIKFRRIFKKLAVIVVLTFLIVSIMFSIFMINHGRRLTEPTNNTAWMSEESYDTAMYFVEFGNNTNFVSNDELITTRITAITKEDLYMRLNLSRVSIERGSVLDLYISDTLYIITSSEYGDNVNIHGLSFEKDEQKLTILMSQNNIKFAIEKNNIPKGQWTRGRNIFGGSKLYQSLPTERYKIYDNGEFSIWNID